MIPLGDNLRSRTFPFINLLIIFVNLFVFYIEVSQPTQESLRIFFDRWSLAPAPFLNYPVEHFYRLFTSMFLHGGWLHLIGNMLYLLVFGDNVEDRVGHFRYLFFYALAGVSASLTQVFINPGSLTPMVGASGAIAGIMGAYFVLYPSAQVKVIVPIFIFLKIIEVPAILFLGFWFAIQAMQGYGSLLSQQSIDVGGVAWWAHAGGFVSGLMLIFIFKKPKRHYV